MATKTWTQTSGNNASTDANWSGGTKPGAGDDIVFDSTSNANCTWDLAVANFKSFTIAATYAGVITNAAAWGTTGDIMLIGATGGSAQFNVTANYVITCGGNCTEVAPYPMTDGIQLVMNGNNTTLSFGNGRGITSLQISATFVTVHPGHTATSGLLIIAGGPCTIDAGCTLYIDGTGTATQMFSVNQYWGGSFTNNGKLIASGSMCLVIFTFIDGAYNLPALGDFTANLQLYLHPGSGTPATVSLVNNQKIGPGGGLEIFSGHATLTLTLSIGAYDFVCGGNLQVDVRGILTGTTGTVMYRGTATNNGTITANIVAYPTPSARGQYAVTFEG